ncbi:MAG: amidohydrolase [Firmicutes bacterium]|nr:amidohydrolase [Bacillota bacterium]
MVLAITNGTVYDGTGKVYRKATVLVEDGKIKAVGEGLKAPEGARVINARGKWVLPGFIEAHTHATLMGEPMMRGANSGDTNEGTDPITSQVRVIDAFYPEGMAIDWVRRAGFTTAMVLPGSANVIGGVGVAFKMADRPTPDDMMIPGTQVMKMALGENPKAVYSQSNKIKTRMGTAAVLRETLRKAKDYSDALKAADGDPAKAPKFDAKLDALVPVIRGEMLCRIHCHRVDDIATAMRICEEFGLKYALEHATEGYKLADKLAEKGIICTIGPLVSGPYKQEVWGRSIMTPQELIKHGVTVCLTEDASILTKKLPMHIGLCIREGLAWEDALKCVTVNPAKLLGISDRVGTLEPGKDADICIWDGDPFCNYSRCDYTIIEGEVYENKRLDMTMM